jgi:hypothetical protein
LIILYIHCNVFNQAAEGLKERVARLKKMYGTGIGSLDDLGGELERNSKSTFENLNYQVKSHSESLEAVSSSLFIVYHGNISISIFAVTTRILI